MHMDLFPKIICGGGRKNYTIALPRIRNQCDTPIPRIQNYVQFVRKQKISFFFFPQKPMTGYGVCKNRRLPIWFVHFDIKMEYSRQRLAIFAHRTFRKFFPGLQFWTWWLENALLMDFFPHWTDKKILPGLGFSKFWLEICFSRQRRVILRHPMFKK